MALRKLAIIGSGDLGEQLAWHATNDNHYDVVGFFDDYAEAGTIKHNRTILGKIDDALSCYHQGLFDELIIAIGYRHFNQRQAIFDRFSAEIPMGRILHSSAYIDAAACVGKGVVVFPGCVVDMKAVLHDNVLLNAGTVVAHDTVIGAHSFLSPGVKVAGFVNVGKCVSLGIGTSVVDNLTISDFVRTGAGAVVTKDLTEAGLYLGVPATFNKL